ncbi:hypothetical protein PtA15_7A97 [Puccinia triticina]|uniref:Uncharacterized protein n=1 Tax=Puccinia triticina TaxID=208348 RepID=A0ABY7CMB4_9BASI|nr:uncharacterized protein PtA15_7A97 [Puccinia triticina]WAQ86371.1 hypothetical protein PtA15_7A97 [Puccinia triticina]
MSVGNQLVLESVGMVCLQFLHTFLQSIGGTGKIFTILFKDSRCVSDYEDNINPNSPPTQIIPRWRSDIFTKVSHQLDEAAILLQKNPRSRSNVYNQLRRGGAKLESPDAEKPMEAPQKFPRDSYDEEYLSGILPIERRHLKMKDPINHQAFLVSLCKQTVRGYKNPDESIAASQGISAAETGNLGQPSVGSTMRIN